MVYAAAKDLVAAYREVQRELASIRFKVNFNTERCRNCDGLKAGPDVIATCFQVQQCNFTNVKESDQDRRHLRVLTSLVK